MDQSCLPVRSEGTQPAPRGSQHSDQLPPCRERLPGAQGKRSMVEMPQTPTQEPQAGAPGAGAELGLFPPAPRAAVSALGCEQVEFTRH